MTIGQEYPSEMIERPDLTLHVDYPVKQLTTKGIVNICQYFTHRTWLMDSKSLIFISDRTGPLELFSVNVENGIITQLTEDSNIALNAWGIAPNDSFILYIGGTLQRELHKLTLNSLKDEFVLKIPEKYDNWNKGIIDIAPDNDTFYFTSTTKITYIPSNLFSGSIKNKNIEPYFSENESNNNHFGHQMLSPADSNIMQINKAPKDCAGDENPQRLWILNIKEKKIRPLYNQHKKLLNIIPHMERVCHESWLPDGKHLCFVIRRDIIKIININGNFGSENSWIASKGPNFWHVSGIFKENMLVADTMWKDTGIYLIEVVPNQQGRLIHLCYSNSQWQHPLAQKLKEESHHDTGAHPHPGWSPNGKYIHFTSFQPEHRGVHLFIVPVKKNPFTSENKN